MGWQRAPARSWQAESPSAPQVIFITEYVSSGSLKQFLKKTKKNHKAMNARVWGVGRVGIQDRDGAGHGVWGSFRNGNGVEGPGHMGAPQARPPLPLVRRSASADRPGSAGARRSCLRSGERLGLRVPLPPMPRLPGAP